MNTEIAPIKKKRGWPKGVKRGPKKVAAEVVASARVSPVAVSQPQAAPKHVKFTGMGARVGIDDEDRLKVPDDLKPDGMDIMWVAEVILGQPEPYERAKYERGGWEPITTDDFGGALGRHFMPKGTKAGVEIAQGGLVLMARPMQLSVQSRAHELSRARQQVRIKEQQITGGDLGTSLDSRHPSALRTNRIEKTFERIPIPGDSK